MSTAYQYKKQQPWQSYFGQPRFYLYEGNNECRDESDGFDTKAEAIRAAQVHIENARDMELGPWIVHIIDRKTKQFIHTEEIQ